MNAEKYFFQKPYHPSSVHINEQTQDYSSDKRTIHKAHM